jgi:hypothetical protein
MSASLYSARLHRPIARVHVTVIYTGTNADEAVKLFAVEGRRQRAGGARARSRRRARCTRRLTGLAADLELERGDQGDRRERARVGEMEPLRSARARSGSISPSRSVHASPHRPRRRPRA